MSAKILKSALSREQVDIIRQVLTLYPQKKQRYDKSLHKMVDEQPDPPITFYTNVDNCVCLPYRAACGILNCILNYHIDLKKSNFEFTGKLRENQLKATAEAEQQLRDYGTTTLKLRTGMGKTVIGSYLSCKSKYYVLVIHPRTALTLQWKETFVQNTTASVWMVGDEKQPQVQPDVIVCFEERTTKIPNAWLDQIGTLIIDEAHLMCTRTKVEPLLCCTNVRNIIVETATMKRNDGLTSMMIAMAGEHCVEEAHSSPFTVYKVMTEFSPSVVKTARGTDWNALLDEIVKCEERNKLIVQIVKRNPERKFLILSVRNEHCDTLYQMLLNAGITSVDIFYGSKIKRYQNSSVLVAGVKKAGTGFDEKNVAYDFDGKRLDTLILATSIFDDVTLEQCCGRVFRSDVPVIYHLIDDNPIIKRHFTQNKKWYDSHNGTVIKKSASDFST
jgi:hypothetical protein